MQSTKPPLIPCDEKRRLLAEWNLTAAEAARLTVLSTKVRDTASVDAYDLLQKQLDVSRAACDDARKAYQRHQSAHDC
jgi:hypothetical protein